MSQSPLEAQLNSFDLAQRSAALKQLIADNPIPPADQGIFNLHCHTFFSFNAYGYSPTALAWLARQSGWRAVGMVDFDVLDGVEEFLTACELAGVRASAGIETRIYVPEFANDEINSPGETGIAYHMGIGFTGGAVSAKAASILSDLRARAAQRNRQIIARVNAYLAPITIDYEHDVLPLTPSANPTERHIVRAYIDAVNEVRPADAAYWAEILAVTRAKAEALLTDTPALHNMVRAKLMKKGGVGYVQPTDESFPSLESFHSLILECGALPCAAWLDGTTSGEAKFDVLLDMMIANGAAALNIIPERNWNIADPDQKTHKLVHLRHVIALAQERDLPLNIGTEMNSYGQKRVDDFSAPEIAAYFPAFTDGTHFIYGHTIMARRFGLGFQSAWAQAHFPIRAERNRFYQAVGASLTPAIAPRLHIDPTWLPADILRAITAL
jgi:PHP domain